jgi:hypothetical protein
VGAGNRASVMIVPLSREKAIENRDSMAKTIYSRLFDYLVSLINKNLEAKEQEHSSISILDIYGFERFELNRYTWISFYLLVVCLQYFSFTYLLTCLLTYLLACLLVYSV